MLKADSPLNKARATKLDTKKIIANESVAEIQKPLGIET